MTKVTSGTRVALNSWLNCPWKRRTAPEPWSRARHEATISACAGATEAPHKSALPRPPPQPLSVPPAPLPTERSSPSRVRKATCDAPLVFYVGLQKAGTTSFMALAAALGYRSIKLANPGSPAYTHADFARTYVANESSALTTMFDNERLLPLAVRYAAGQSSSLETASRELTLAKGTLTACAPLDSLHSDFPIFALPCQLALAYPRASFVAFERHFDSWFESERADVLCAWMRSKVRPARARSTSRSMTVRPESVEIVSCPVLCRYLAKGDRRGPRVSQGKGYTSSRRGSYTMDMWTLGRDFMNSFWGDGFRLFWRALETQPDLCSANSSLPTWQTIKGLFRSRFDAHEEEVRRCIPTARLLQVGLTAPNAGAEMARFLGCTATAVGGLPHRTGACKSCASH